MEHIFIEAAPRAGAPENLAERTAEERAAYALLDRLDVSYLQIDHDPAMTIAACADIDAKLGVSMCKNLFLCNAQKSTFYLLLMPGDKLFRTKELSHQIGSARLSFADETYLWELLRIHPGAVSAMGLMNDTACRVRLLIDAELLQAEYFGCHPCVNTSSLRIRTKDLLETVLPAMGHKETEVVLPR